MPFSFQAKKKLATALAVVRSYGCFKRWHQAKTGEISLHYSVYNSIDWRSKNL